MREASRSCSRCPLNLGSLSGAAPVLLGESASSTGKGGGTIVGATRNAGAIAVVPITISTCTTDSLRSRGLDATRTRPAGKRQMFEVCSTIGLAPTVCGAFHLSGSKDRPTRLALGKMVRLSRRTSPWPIPIDRNLFLNTNKTPTILGSSSVE